MRESGLQITTFLKAIMRYWWALMSCAAFTILGLWATYGEKGREWILWTSLVLAIAFALVAAYQGWANEHQALLRARQEVEALTAKPDIAIAVDGIFAHVKQGEQILVILPDVTVANNSHGLRVAITADLWMLRSGNMECWCSSETKPVVTWEESEHSSRHNLLVLPLNLQPRCAEIGYLAFGHRVLKGIGNEPLLDEHGHCRYRIEFKDVHSGSVIHQEQITVSQHLTEQG
jgi:hypothetical protein